VGIKKYPLELRRRAVQVYRETDPKPVIAELADQFGVHQEALRNWIRQDEADRGERHDRPRTDIVEENRRLKRTAKELRAANEVLLAAGMYFASETWRSPAEIMNFVDQHNFSVGLVLKVLDIPSSTYYNWRKAMRSPSIEATEGPVLLRLIDEIEQQPEADDRSGSPHHR
jgi:transposase